MGAETLPNPWMHPAVFVLVALMVAAFCTAVYSAFRAFFLSRDYQPYRDLGLKRWMMGTLVIRYMPADAIVYVKRYVAAFAVFILSLAGLFIFSYVQSAPLP